MIQRNDGSTTRNMCWDEENRLVAVRDQVDEDEGISQLSVYIYDGGGERAWKFAGAISQMYINGQGYVDHVNLNKTLYISPLMVMTEQEYTKHYFIEGERVVSKIGGGFDGAPYMPTDEPLEFISVAPDQFVSDLYEMVNRDINCTGDLASWKIEETIKPAHNDDDEVEKKQYFYHPDHLGSSSFITNAIGYATQHLQYLPFGESFIDQRNNYSSRYTFSAKEKDNETGYNYFGARYYDSDLSVWLSVDPMSDKYPSTSPYMYVLGNPVRLVDPNGMAPGEPPFTFQYYSPSDPTFWCNYDTYRDGYVSQFTVNKNLVGAGAILLTPVIIAFAPEIGAGLVATGSAISSGASAAYSATTTVFARGLLSSMSFGQSLFYSRTASSVIGGLSEFGAGFALNESLYSSISSGRYSYAFSFAGLSANYLYSIVWPDVSDFFDVDVKKDKGFNLSLLQQDNTQAPKHSADESIVPELRESYNTAQDLQPNYNYSFSAPSNNYQINQSDNTKANNVPMFE